MARARFLSGPVPLVALFFLAAGCAPAPAPHPALAFGYREVAREVVNTGPTLQVNYPPGSSMTVGGTTYQLLQFHTPAEHRLHGKELPDEPIQMSEAQIQAVRSVIGTTNRPVQPLGSRTLMLDS